MNNPKFKIRDGLISLFLLGCLAALAPLAAAWEREPNSVFAERRAKLEAAINAPVVLFGYTGHEEANPSYVFRSAAAASPGPRARSRSSTAQSRTATTASFGCAIPA